MTTFVFYSIHRFSLRENQEIGILEGDVHFLMIKHREGEVWQTEQRVTIAEGTGRRSTVHLDGVQGEERRKEEVDTV